MIKIEKTQVAGFEPAIRGMRNPKNSWEKSDSVICKGMDGFADCTSSINKCPRKEDVFTENVLCIGEADWNLANILSGAGSDHGKFMRMIVVWADITAPLYWWKEFDTYKVGTVADSCSTMHKIDSRDLDITDFSIEHMTRLNKRVLENTITAINDARTEFKAFNNKEYWWQMIQLLPSSYNQKRTVMMNYAVLKNMYHARKNHKLDEWRVFCEWIESLPYSELITGKDDENG